jgi:Domain of unknown function (DUF4389)
VDHESQDVRIAAGGNRREEIPALDANPVGDSARAQDPPAVATDRAGRSARPRERHRPFKFRKTRVTSRRDGPQGEVETMEPSQEGQAAYPVQFSVAYPGVLNRMTTAFRLIWLIPIAIVYGLVGGHQEAYGAGNHDWTIGAGAGGLLFLAPLVMILFRQKYPRWWFDWNQELLRFSNRVGVYLALMDDHYPSTDEHQNVALDFPYPDAKEGLNRWLPLVKWFLAIPHYILLVFLWIAAIVSVIIAWFAILFTGRYPRGLFEFVLGVMRWTNRVIGYAFILVTDQYPPFQLSE